MEQIIISKIITKQIQQQMTWHEWIYIYILASIVWNDSKNVIDIDK